MLTSIKSFILRFQNSPGVSIKLEEQRIKASWQDILGEVDKNARGKSEALYLKENGELVVGVVNNMWMQELSFRKEDIKKQLQKESNIVKSIRFTSANYE